MPISYAVSFCTPRGHFETPATTHACFSMTLLSKLRSVNFPRRCRCLPTLVPQWRCNRRHAPSTVVVGTGVTSTPKQTRSGFALCPPPHPPPHPPPPPQKNKTKKLRKYSVCANALFSCRGTNKNNSKIPDKPSAPWHAQMYVILCKEKNTLWRIFCKDMGVYLRDRTYNTGRHYHKQQTNKQNKTYQGECTRLYDKTQGNTSPLDRKFRHKISIWR